MKYTIESDFQNLFRPLTAEELAQAKLANEADPDHERIPPVVVWKADDKNKIVVDGHHTLKIRENMRVNGKTPKIRFAEMEFADRHEALAYAVRCQLGRRNLDASQIAIALAKLPKAKRGPKAEEIVSRQLTGNSREALAEDHGISEATMTRADKVVEQGAKSIVEAVQQGDVAVSDAASIVDLPKSEQTAALRKVKSGKAKTLRAAAPKAKPKPKAGKAEDNGKQAVVDHFKLPVPESLDAVFSSRAEFRSVMKSLSDCKGKVAKLAEQKCGVHVDSQETCRLIDTAHRLLRFAMPYTECAKCRRTLAKSCPACKGSGWVNETMYKSSFSDADKRWVEKR